MYEGWEPERWETPISDFKSIALVSLIDDGAISITVEAIREPGRPRWCFRFERAPIYQNTLEEYRLELWNRPPEGGSRIGWTAIIPDSPWIERLREKEPLLKQHFQKLTHFQISTEDDVIDIVSPEMPTISSAPPGLSNDPKPGKSRVFYANEDRREIDALIDETNFRRDE